MSSQVKNSPPTKPTLPNLLTEYGMTEQKAQKKKHHRKQHRQRAHQTDRPEMIKREKSSLEVEERKRIRDQKFQHMCEDPEKVRGYFFDDYKQKVKEKIAKQNEMYEKRVQQLDQEIKRKEEKMINKGLAYRKKIMKRHDLETDNSHLNKAFKSYFYRVMSVQEKLEKEGKLKTITDVEAFWEKAKNPALFEAYLSDKDVLKERFSVSPSSVPTSAFSSRTPSPSGRRTGSPISRVLKDSEAHSLSVDAGQESSNDQNTGDWHILEGIEEGGSSPSLRSGRKSELSSAKTVSATQVAKMAAQQLEKRFPKQELPKLHCFTMQLTEKPPDPEELQREAEVAVREQKRKTFVKKLRRMYQLALTNQASSQRILAKHADEMKMLTEGPRLADLYESYDNTAEIDESEEPVVDPRVIHPALPAFLTESAYSPILEEDEDDLYSTSRSNTASSRSSSVYSSGNKSRSTSKSEVIRPSTGERNIIQLEPMRKPSPKIKKRSPEPIMYTVENKPPGLHPLTMGAILQNEKVMEPKCVSSFWTNYMHAGKSVFAKST